MVGALVALYIVGALSLFFVMRYNLHMFQLNGYKNDEQFHWLIINKGKQALLILVAVMAAILFFVCNVVTVIISIIIMLIVLKYYTFLRSVNTKKKLVYTMRVRRLIVSDVILSAIIIALSYFAKGLEGVAVSEYFVIALQPFVVIFANIVNIPVEKAVNRHFINDAKRILKQNSHIKVIGVTGSYGKTSVKFYLNTLLQEKFNVLVTPESYNTPMGVVKTIRGMMKSTHELFICEMGARHVGDIKEICDIVSPDCGMITSVGPQHLETFLSMENIVSTKFELADALPEGGMLFLNGDNEYIRNKAGEYNNTFFYSTGCEVNGYIAKDIKLSQMGTTFTVVAPDKEECVFQTRLVGEHNVINIVGAISVAAVLGIKLKDLRVPVRRIQSVPHRMQLIEKGNVTIIDDAFNSNPVGSKAAVETLKLFDGIRILITPGMVELGDKEEEYNYKFGTYAAKCCDYIYLIGKKRTEPIMNGVMSMDFPKDKCIACDNLEEAMNYANAIKGDKHKYILLENDLPDNY
ncbi:MAG: UDP-N-acetylmuramoyl-tripeptide--D-alanyl-D-alanine ligase [Lachnospiraceae bacterium]|nr:UDP-N-acetylmuramoyl-tripeptide--D-alanyl-D-alanine ligase [Lachnospiraceae bacterium]